MIVEFVVEQIVVMCSSCRWCLLICSVNKQGRKEGGGQREGEGYSEREREGGGRI